MRLKLHYNYTASGYLSNITNAVTGIVYWQATAQDAAGRPLQEQLGNGLTTSRSYDAVGRLKTLQTGASIQNLSYTYDLAGNLTTRHNTAQAFSETFAYDALNRLTGVSGPAPKTMAYSLDGNITHKSDVSDAGGYLYGTPVTPTGPAGPHTLTTLRKNNTVVASYTYDNNGNMLSGAGRSYTYTSDNLPKTITQGTATTAFAYSAERVRIKHTAPGETTVYINPRWDTGTHYEKTTKPISGGSVTEHQHYLYGSTGPVAVHKVIATTTGTGTTTASNTRYLHRDHLGSVDAITSDTGALVERLSYDAWGKRRQPNGLDATAPITGTTTHHGYTGHEHLDSLGLIHMNARVYDPNIGRFSSADPIGFEGGINLYGYAGGNPLTWLDLSGLDISYANHEVKAGLYHSLFIITPVNQDLYIHDPRFQNFDLNGYRFATIGAGPNIFLHLEAGINRPRDISDPIHFSKKLDLPNLYANEDDAIQRLFELANNYNQNKTWYTLLPQNIFGFATGWNSNSFIAGLGQAADFTLPAPGTVGGATPGYQNPIPSFRFDAN